MYILSSLRALKASQFISATVGSSRCVLCCDAIMSEPQSEDAYKMNGDAASADIPVDFWQ
jgi:hypothetical protein